MEAQKADKTQVTSSVSPTTLWRILKKGKATLVFDDNPSYNGMDPTAMSARLGLSVAQGTMLLPKEGRLNDKFTDIELKSIERFMTEAWSNK